jgi:hypothetical protein
MKKATKQDFDWLKNKYIMKIKILLSTLFASFLLVTNLSAQQPKLEWAKQMGGTDSETGLSITTDASSNIYITGYFGGTVDFDPGSGTMNLISNGGRDIFIQKLDANGNLLWVKQMGGSGTDEGRSVAADASGNVFTTGGFAGTVDFDPGSGTTKLTANGKYDIFVQKLDASGNFLWAKQMGGTEYERGVSNTTDASGNVYTTGYFGGTVDFDPGTGTADLTSNGLEDIFIQKLDTNGNLLWVKQIGGPGNDGIEKITTDASGNVYTTGAFGDTVDFDPGTGTKNLTSHGFNDFFIQKLDSDGNFIWVQQIGGTGNDFGRSITTDINGNIYTIGLFSDTVDFDPGTGTSNLISNGMGDIFIQKLDAAGNFIWAKQMGGTANEYAISITTDANGNVYTAGYFGGTVDFDPGAGTLIFNSNNYDIFIQKLDAAGNLIWAKQMGGTGFDYGYAITTDDNDNVYTTGWFQGTADFDSGSGTAILTSNGLDDTFILKLSQSATVGITENTFSENIQVYPNPTTGNFSIKFKTVQKDLSVRIMSISGQTIETRIFQDTDFVQLKLDQPKGLYLLEITKDFGNKVVFKIIKE